jgi:hypothetical protein
MGRTSPFFIAVSVLVACGSASPVPAGSSSPSPVPPSSWVIHINQEGRFAVHHPPDWGVRTRREQGLVVSLAPPGEQRGIDIRLTPQAPPLDLPNSQCQKVLVSQLPGVRCRDTMARSVVTTLPDTSQGTFVFEVAVGSAAYREYDQVLATFQLLRGMS